MLACTKSVAAENIQHAKGVRLRTFLPEEQRGQVAAYGAAAAADRTDFGP